jgi:hypothetical protein
MSTHPVGDHDHEQHAAAMSSHEEARGTHAEAHGDHDLRRTEEAALGPVDWPAWRATLVGVAVAALVVLFFYLPTYGRGVGG